MCLLFPCSGADEFFLGFLQKQELSVKMDCDTTEEATVKNPAVIYRENSDVICLISDDEEDADCMVVEQKADHVETAVKNVSVQTHQIQNKKAAEPAVGAQSDAVHLDSSDLVTFIQKHCYNNIYSADPKDLVQLVSNTPYCLYLYVGVQVGGGQSTSFVLVGYFDQSSDESVVKLLHTLQMSVDTVDPHNSEEDLQHAAKSDACLLMETLNKLALPLSNLAVFYCSAPRPGLSQLLEAHLKTLSPKMVSLCSINGVAGRACQAALMASFSHVVDLIRNIHHHYSTFPSVNDTLKEVFSNTGSFNPLRPVSAQCLFIVNSVQKMATSWQDLLEYFELLEPLEGTKQIKTQLMDEKVKLHFLFLSHSLEPLRALQDLQQSGTASLMVELKLVSILFQSYAASILRPSAVERFLCKRDLLLLQQRKELLPSVEVKVGSHAADFMWAASLDRSEQDRKDFLRDAQGFYQAALESLVESVPELLWDLTQRDFGRLLKDPKLIIVRTIFFY